MHSDQKHFKMNIQQIKTKLGFETLSFSNDIDSEGVKSEWVRHWDNQLRISVSMTEENFHKIKSLPQRDDLVMHVMDKIASDKLNKDGEEVKGQPYTHIVIFINENSVGSL